MYTIQIKVKRIKTNFTKGKKLLHIWRLFNDTKAKFLIDQRFSKSIWHLLNNNSVYEQEYKYSFK